MRVTVAYPPDFTPPSIPFGSLALLNACLKADGHGTQLADLNAWAFDVLIRPANLDRYFVLLDATLADLESRPDLSPGDAARLAAFRKLRVFPRELILGAREAAALLRDPDRFYDPEQFRPAHRTVLATHAFLNSMTRRVDSRSEGFVEDLYECLADETPDAYVDAYGAEIIPAIVAFGPQLIALTCPYAPQVATGMRFAKMVRAALPGVRFVMGGTGLADAEGALLSDPRFFEVIDFAATGDGEETLPLLAAALEGRGSLDDVPSLWRMEGGAIVPPRVKRNADLDLSPTPDYSDLDFGRYMLPEKSGVYTTSRGCYYDQCTFCPESFRTNFRMRAPERVYADVRDLVLRQGVRFLHFFDPLTPPRTLAHVARETAREGLPLAWHAEVKFEAIYTSESYVRRLAAGGCKLLQFGLESSVQRVLDRMKKGNRIGQVEEILDLLGKHGIPVAVTWFIGFPTEDEEDARETWRFIRRRREEIHLSLYTGTFGLGPDVPVFHDPAAYGIRLKRDASGNHEYERLDGGDWDQEALHRGFQARSDIPALIGGAALLYAARDPALLKELRGAAGVGPVAWEEPPLIERTLAVAREIGVAEVRRDAAGLPVYGVYVPVSGEHAESDAADVALLALVGREGRPAAEILADPRAPADSPRRLADLVDRGAIESR